eukprot:scpid65615/ scgid15036/ 
MTKWKSVHEHLTSDWKSFMNTEKNLRTVGLPALNPKPRQGMSTVSTVFIVLQVPVLQEPVYGSTLEGNASRYSQDWSIWKNGRKQKKAVTLNRDNSGNHDKARPGFEMSQSKVHLESDSRLKTHTKHSTGWSLRHHKCSSLSVQCSDNAAVRVILGMIEKLNTLALFLYQQDSISAAGVEVRICVQSYLSA